MTVNARLQSDAVRAGIKSASVFSRVLSFQTGRSGENITLPAGTPIGLLLALTYSGDTVMGSYGERPTVRIANA